MSGLPRGAGLAGGWEGGQNKTRLTRDGSATLVYHVLVAMISARTLFTPFASFVGCSPCSQLPSILCCFWASSLVLAPPLCGCSGSSSRSGCAVVALASGWSPDRRAGTACDSAPPDIVASRWSLEKKQGRRRSITPTALPAPDIEIGLRHPVNCMMPRNITGKCDPVHNR